MININTKDNSITIQSDNKYSYPFQDGTLNIPKNSIYLVVDESDYVTFRSTENGNVIIGSKISDLKIDGQSVTKDGIVDVFAESMTDEIGGAKVEVVDELPEEGKEGQIYLVPSPSEEEDNIYDEYIFANGAYEKIGSKKIDLSPYLKIEDAENTYQAKLTTGDGIYIKDNVISTKPYSTTANTYVAWADADGNWSVEYFNDGVIPSNKYASNTNIYKVQIGGNITSIGTYAFNRCTSLTSIDIPNSVTSIGMYAFQSCSGLTSVTIPDSVTSIDNNAFRTCTNLTSVTIGSGVTSLISSTFLGCNNLTSVVIPNSVTSIGYQVFRLCTSLTSVTIPNSVTSISAESFVNVPTQGTLYCNEDWFNNLSDTYKTNLGNVANWSKVWTPKPIEGRVDDLETKLNALFQFDEATNTLNIITQ